MHAMSMSKVKCVDEIWLNYISVAVSKMWQSTFGCNSVNNISNAIAGTRGLPPFPALLLHHALPSLSSPSSSHTFPLSLKVGPVYSSYGVWRAL